MDLTEPARLLAMLDRMDIRLVNLTAGSPYYTPHLQRPAAYPPSDGYRPPQDPLVEVARQMNAVRVLKGQFPELIIVGTAYSYLQDYLPNVAQAAVRMGWVDSVGLGRMVLTLSRDAVGRDRWAGASTQAGLPDVQRLHYRAPQWLALRLLSARRALQKIRDGAAPEEAKAKRAAAI